MTFDVFVADDMLNPAMGEWITLPCDSNNIPDGVITDNNGGIFAKAVREMTNIHDLNKILKILNETLNKNDSDWAIFEAIYKEAYDNKNLFDSIYALNQVVEQNFIKYDLSDVPELPMKIDLAMEIMASKTLDDESQTLLDVLLTHDIVNIIDIDKYIEQESVIKVSDDLYISDGMFNDNITDPAQFVRDYKFYNLND